MKIFLDTANLEEIKYASELGLIDGVTTNPSIIAKETGKKMTQIIESITKVLPNGSISAEVISQEYEEILKEANILSKISQNVCIKLPINRIGLRVCAELSNRGISTNMTLCFSLTQAIMAAKAGATFVSPFIGRLEDAGYDAIKLISDIKQTFDNFPEYSTEILAASIRNISHINNVAKIGADIITIPYQLFVGMYTNPLSELALKKFIEDSKKINFN